MATPKPEVSVGAVVVEDGRLLLIQRGRPPGAGLWSVPGGRVEGGERMAEAVEREVAEETGLTVRCGPILGVVERIGEGWHFVIVDHLASVVGSARATAGDDAEAVRWVPLDAVAGLPLVDGLLDFLRHHGVVPAP